MTFNTAVSSLFTLIVLLFILFFPSRSASFIFRQLSSLDVTGSDVASFFGDASFQKFGLCYLDLWVELNVFRGVLRVD
jgi:hypothetical protein